MKKSIKTLIPVFIFMMLAVPVLSLAADTSADQGLIPCGRSAEGADPSTMHPCQFNDFLTLINKVIQFFLFKMVVPIAAIMFAYAGVLLVTAGGGEAKTKAKHIFSNVVLGLIIAIAAWAIIRTILAILGFDGSWIGF